MTQRSMGQSWALDIALRQGGFNALHPEAKNTLLQLGHDSKDFDKVFENVRAGVMLPKAWASVATEAESRAANYERDGFRRTASDLYVRAAVMWGRAQYSILDVDDPRKTAFRVRCDHCVKQLGALRGNRVRRVAIDFEGKQIFGLLHLPAGTVRSAPAVILGPGMDMIKEDYIYAAERYYTARGAVALSVEGPGQGESRACGLMVDLDNYERALEAFVDYLAELPEVDSARIGMFGISMSSYWSLRALAKGSKLKALAAFEAPVGSFKTMFEAAQPGFKNNYMFMSGYTDESKFDVEMTEKMPLADLMNQIKAPILMGNGEFDELTPIADALGEYEKIRAPKEIRVYEDEFHPLGGVAAEAFTFGAEWVLLALDGAFSEAGRDAGYYVKQDGTTVKGEARPSWWLSEKGDPK